MVVKSSRYHCGVTALVACFGPSLNMTYVPSSRYSALNVAFGGEDHGGFTSILRAWFSRRELCMRNLKVFETNFQFGSGDGIRLVNGKQPWIV